MGGYGRYPNTSVLYGTSGNLPAASAVPYGTIYFETDVDSGTALLNVDGTWTVIAAPTVIPAGYLGANAVTAPAIAASAVTTAKIATDAVTGVKIEDTVIDNRVIGEGCGNGLGGDGAGSFVLPASGRWMLNTAGQNAKLVPFSTSDTDVTGMTADMRLRISVFTNATAPYGSGNLVVKLMKIATGAGGASVLNLSGGTVVASKSIPYTSIPANTVFTTYVDTSGGHGVADGSILFFQCDSPVLQVANSAMTVACRAQMLYS